MTTKKLLDDCFSAASDLVAHDDAIVALRDAVAPIVSLERVALAEAVGRTLAENVVAVAQVPQHNNAAVDGYGYCYSDYDPDKGATFPISGRAAAGHPLARQPHSGTAVRILTGAVVPTGIDSVVMQEDVQTLTEAGAACVALPPGLKPGANIRPAGEDLAKDERLYAAGHRVRAQDLAALASIGRAEVSCYTPLRVAIVSTGDEVIPVDSGPLEPGQVFDANTPMLKSLATAAGCEVTDLGIWRDDAAEVRRQLKEAAAAYDVVLTSGGASKGEEDHLAAALAASGQRHFWQIAVKPGRPIMFGQIDGTPVIGLPGNPVAVFVCFLMYVHPVLRRLGGSHWHEPRRYRLPAAFAVEKRKLGRREFWRGRIVSRETGLAVEKFARDGSGLISGLRFADGLIDIPEDTPAVAEGDSVQFIPFSEFGILT
jgi:molybdopterin molybdotransferase